MPRVENLGPNVDAWYAKSGGDGTSTYDLCAECAGELDGSPHLFNDKLQPYQHNEPQGDDGWGGEVEHPPYDDGDDYRCTVCNRRLRDDKD